MRIISGLWRGRRLAVPPGQATRPTADRARQGLFNMLEHAGWSPGLVGVRVLDLFAGSGALGLEALSRGAASCVFVEQAAPALSALRANITACHPEQDRTVILARDATTPLALPGPLVPLDLVLADPPYGKGLAARALAVLSPQALAPHAVAVVEEATGHDPGLPDCWKRIEQRSYGAATFHVLRHDAAH